MAKTKISRKRGSRSGAATAGTRRRRVVEEDEDEPEDDEDEEPEEDEDEYEDDEDEDGDEEEEDEPPRRSKSKAPAKKAGAKKGGKGYGGGWDANKRMRKEHPSGNYLQNFKVTNDEQLIIFLDDEPFDNYLQHWVDEAKPPGVVCIDDTDGPCPLCDAGDQGRAIASFNVIDVATSTTMRLDAPPMLCGSIEEAANSKSGPLARDKNGNVKYWKIVNSGKTKQKPNFNISRVNSQALEEDWEQEPLSDKEIAQCESEKLDSSSTKRKSKLEIRKLVRKLIDDDDYEDEYDEDEDED